MASKKTLTREEVMSIIEKRKEGKNNRQIAQELGVHEQTIYKWVLRLRTAGHEISRRKSGYKKMEL